MAVCESNKQIMIGCINGVPTEVVILTYPLSGNIDYLYYQNGVIANITGNLTEVGFSENCPEYDYEKLVLCEVATGAKVLVESWTNEEDPTQVRTTRYTYLATNLPFTGNPDTDLTDCGSEKLDIQTKQYCDNGETVWGTLVFDVSQGGPNPTLLGIVFHKIDGSVHTPVAPVEGACNVYLSVLDTYIDVGNGTYASVSGAKEINIRYDAYKNGFIPSVPNITAVIVSSALGTKTFTVIPNTSKTIQIGTSDITSVTISGAINNTVEITFIN